MLRALYLAPWLFARGLIATPWLFARGLIAAALLLVVVASIAGCEEDPPPSPTTPSASAQVQASTSATKPATAAPPDDDDPPIPAGSDTPPELSGSVPPPIPAPKSSAVAKAPPTSQPSADPAPKTTPDPAPQAKTEPDPQPQPSAPPIQLEPAKKGSADEIAEKVDAVYKPIERFRARFKQKYVAKIAGTTKHSEGVVWVKRPDKLSFRYQDPNKNRVVSDGTTLKVFEHENKQMFVKPVSGTEYPGAFSFIMGKGLRENFTFEFHKEANWEGGPVLIGRPRVANPGYKVVLFYIDDALLQKGDPRCVRRVLVVDAQGNKNRFDFLAIDQPDTIDDVEFTFTPPKGTNILQ